MKVERWYDVRCNECGRHLSTDFDYGLLYTRKEAIKCAKIAGFKEDKASGKVRCPFCIKGEKPWG